MKSGAAKGPARASPATDPQTRALVRRAGLRHVNDAQPGLRRVTGRGAQGGFSYRDADGRVVRDAETLARIQRLAIPPAWESVWICADDSGHLQATGRDARGRKQYRYHAAWQTGRGETKFDSLRDFGKVLPRIRRRVQSALAAPDGASRERVLAALVRLLDTTWLRIGNTEYARSNHSYGLSTLKNRHAGVKGDELRLSFVGKSGVRHEATLSDRRVARLVRHCRELPGQALFQYRDDSGEVHRIDSSDVNGWLAEAAGTHCTAKDFRTWHGSVLALELTLAACAENAAACTPMQVLKGVASRLGNTPAVCKKAYIHPQVLTLSAALGDAAARSALRQARWATQAAPRRGLSAAERRLLAMLSGRRA